MNESVRSSNDISFLGFYIGWKTRLMNLLEVPTFEMLCLGF